MMPPRHRPAPQSTNLRLLSLLIIFAAMPALGGCAAGRQPEIRIADLSWSEISSEAAVLDVDLELRNPSSHRLDLLEFQYHLAIDGRRAYTGRHAARTSLGPGDERRMTIPAVIRFESVDWSADRIPTDVNYELSGHLLYTLPGYFEQILYDAGVLRPRQGFSERGRLRSDAEADSSAAADRTLPG